MNKEDSELDWLSVERISFSLRFSWTPLDFTCLKDFIFVLYANFIERASLRLCRMLTLFVEGIAVHFFQTSILFIEWISLILFQNLTLFVNGLHFGFLRVRPGRMDFSSEPLNSRFLFAEWTSHNKYLELQLHLPRAKLSIISSIAMDHGAKISRFGISGTPSGHTFTLGVGGVADVVQYYLIIGFKLFGLK